VTNLNSTDRDIRKFGCIAVLVFGAFSALAIWRDKQVMTYFFGTLLFLGFCFLLLPKPFKPVYKTWLKIAHMIGTLITMVILTLFFYLVITPAAAAKRVFGGSPLPRKPSPELESYWVPRKEPAQSKERFYLRY